MSAVGGGIVNRAGNLRWWCSAFEIGIHAGIPAKENVKFGINTVGELGNLAIGKIGLG